MAPVVALDNVTDCAVVYIAAAGEAVGAETAPLMVYAAEATAESENVDLVANALIVIELETLMAVEYTEEAVVGVVPSVV